MKRMNQPVRIAYLMKTFPRLSETFILNEILGLERLGLDLEIFSLKRPEGEPLHPTQKDVRASVSYLSPPGPPPHVLAKLLAAADHLVLFSRQPARYAGAVRYFFHNYSRRFFKYFIKAGRLARELQRRQIDHLHAHFANVPATVADLVHQLSGIPYSFTAHAKDIYLTDTVELQRKLASAEFVLTCTQFNQQHLNNLSTTSTPIHLAYHGIDFGRFQSKEARAISPEETPLILSVGRFCEKKGFPYLIRACGILKVRNVKFRCGIVGYGPLQADLEQLIRGLGLEDEVKILGKMTQDQLVSVYQTSSAFVLPCLVTDDGDRDGIPNVLAEAMAMSLPVVSTNISGIAELVDHAVNGLLVDERDAVALADAMELLLKNEPLRRQLADKGREKVQRFFQIDRNAKVIFDHLMESHSRSSPDNVRLSPRPLEVSAP